MRTQQRQDTNKLYALHAPEVECIGKGKARKPCEFGVKSAVVVSHQHGLILGARTLPGNPYDSHILGAVLKQTANLTRDLPVKVKRVVIDLGLSRRGQRQAGQGDHSQRQVQKPEQAAESAGSNGKQR